MSDAQVCLDNDKPINAAVPAAKLHVLQLEPIKAKVGEKWPRLAQLVHVLFEKALKRAQGPLDHFVPVGELSYIATFHGRTAEEAAIACASVAREVCELLFGDDAGDIAVRSLVGTVPESHARPDISTDIIVETLERTGQEVLITKTRGNAGRVEEVRRSRAVATHYPIRLCPVWDMGKFTSSFLFLSPAGTGADTRRYDENRDDERFAEQEIRLLQAAGEYAQRVQVAGKICAVGVGVGWQTLSGSSMRQRYVAALKALQAAPNCPLLVKIEGVPMGMPIARLAEMVAMLGAGGVRVLAEFAADISIPDLNIKIGAVGIGTRLPTGCSFEKAQEIMKMLNRRLLRQSAFSFVGGLANRGFVELASEMHVRFGLGAALDKGMHLTGSEQIPDFPLHSGVRLSGSRARHGLVPKGRRCPATDSLSL